MRNVGEISHTDNFRRVCSHGKKGMARVGYFMMLNILKMLVPSFGFIYILLMSDCNIKIPDTLYERLKVLANEKGYSSAEEMALHILEKAADNASPTDHDLSGVLSGVVYPPSAAPEATRALAKTEASAKVKALSEPAERAKVESIKHQLKGLGYFNG